MISNDPQTRRYDMDAANEIKSQFGPKSVVTLGSEKGNVDLHVPDVGNDAWSSVLFVVAAQIQAIVWSDTLRLNIDNPFSTNNLTRVVRGVVIYPLE
jgi:fructoselysine-6-P-deglycase FrlB-like protein